MRKKYTFVHWLLIPALVALQLPNTMAQEETQVSQTESAESEVSSEVTDEGSKNAAIVSQRDASATIPPLQSTAANDASKSEVAVNWENVTLKDCIEVLSRDLGMEFIISPSVNVSQEVSIRAGDVTAWTRDNKLELFDAVLDTAGIQRIQRGRVWIFAPSDVRPILKAFEDSAFSDGQPIIGVIQLKNIDASSAQQFLNSVGGKTPRVFGMKGSSILMVLGTKAYLKQMEELVKLIDFPPSVMMHYVLKEADSEDMARELTSVFYKRTGSDGSEIRFISVPRLNTLVANNIPDSMLSEIDRWVKLLDRSDGTNERITKVYRMQVIDAETIGKTLAQLYSDLYRQAQEREKEIGKTAAKTAASQAKQAAATPAAPAPKSSSSKSSSSKSSSSKSSSNTASAPAAPSPSKSTNGGSEPASSSPMDEEVIILSDKDTNTLIINAPGDMHKEIALTIKELDQSRRQVLIETTMVEVTLDDNTDLGVEWAIQGTGDPASAGMLKSGLGLDELAKDTVPFASAAQGLTYFITSNDKKLALIHAARQDDRLQVLSSPNVLTRDGMEATVSFGKEVPIQQSTLSSGGNENFSYDYRDAKISLTVTPHIDDGNMVTLTLLQEVRRVEEDTLTPGGAPTFKTREISSNLQVDSGQTIVLGGLIERADIETRIGIPYLMDIPAIGWLFGRNITSKQGSEILMILTPHVVNSRDETDLLTRDFRRKILGSMSEKDVRELYDLEDGPYVPKKIILPEPGATEEQE
jgi:general secretion pathway protein D